MTNPARKFDWRNGTLAGVSIGTAYWAMLSFMDGHPTRGVFLALLTYILLKLMK